LISEKEHPTAYGQPFLYPGFRFGQFSLAILKKKGFKIKSGPMASLLKKGRKKD